MDLNSKDNELEELRRKRMEELAVSMNKTPRAAPTGGKPVVVTDAEFDRMVGSPGLVLVDCWAPWCGPCRMLGPTLEKFAKKYAGRVTVAKLNTDENQATAMRFQIMSIPTMMLFKDGKLVDKFVGALPLGMIERKVAPHL